MGRWSQSRRRGAGAIQAGVVLPSPEFGAFPPDDWYVIGSEALESFSFSAPGPGLDGYDIRVSYRNPADGYLPADFIDPPLNSVANPLVELPYSIFSCASIFCKAQWITQGASPTLTGPESNEVEISKMP
jgi:hypothetical protein